VVGVGGSGWGCERKEAETHGTTGQCVLSSDCALLRSGRRGRRVRGRGRGRGRARGRARAPRRCRELTRWTVCVMSRRKNALSNTHTHAHMRTHTETHTHLNAYRKGCRNTFIVRTDRAKTMPSRIRQNRLKDRIFQNWNLGTGRQLIGLAPGGARLCRRPHWLLPSPNPPAGPANGWMDGWMDG